MKKESKDATKVVHLGRNPEEQGWMVNPPIYQASTIVFPKYKDLLNAEKSYPASDCSDLERLRYGRYGTQTNFSLERAVAEIEGGDNSFIVSSGAAAINVAFFAFLKQGDHLLLVDNAYFPTRGFADKYLKKFGIETTYYDPKIGADIKNLIQNNTKMIFMESPSSLTFDVADIPAICKVAQENNIITVIDNSWASGIYFKPFDHGVDISIIALTKYINGHSDVMMGSITVKKKYYKVVYDAFKYYSASSAPFSAYMTQRGLRTAKVRMDHCSKTALELAKWLEQRSEVSKVFYPALESDEGHELWKRDFTGAAGLFSIVLDKKYSEDALGRMVDDLELYSMGYSWGGYESLILPFEAADSKSSKKWSCKDKTCLRINVGLEDIEDLKADLDSGFKRLVK